MSLWDSRLALLLHGHGLAMGECYGDSVLLKAESPADRLRHLRPAFVSYPEFDVLAEFISSNKGFQMMLGLKL